MIFIHCQCLSLNTRIGPRHRTVSSTDSRLRPQESRLRTKRKKVGPAHSASVPRPLCKCPDISIVLGTGNPGYENIEDYMAWKKYKDGWGQWGHKFWWAAMLCEKYRAIASSGKSSAEKEKELGQLCAEFAGYIARFNLDCSDLDYGEKRELLRFLSTDADLRFLSPDESPGLSYLPGARHDVFGTACKALAKLFKMSERALKYTLKSCGFLSFMDKSGRQYFYNDGFHPGHDGEVASESIIIRDALKGNSDLQCKRPPPGKRVATSEDAKKKRK